MQQIDAYAPDLVVLPHPSWRNTAWLKRNPWFEAEVAPYLQVAPRAVAAASAFSRCT